MFASRTNWPLEPNRLAQAIDAARRRGTRLLDLTASNPTTCGFQYPEREILAALADRRALEYAPESKGRLEARQAVAEYYCGRPAFAGAAARAGGLPAGRQGSGVSMATETSAGRSASSTSGSAVDPERIILTAGTSEAYTYVFRLLCEPGDEVLVPAPSYPLFDFLADLADVRLAPYRLVYDHGWQIDFGALREALSPRSRAVLVVHPNNPTGSFVSAREAAELAEICAARGMAIVADEVFLDYAAAPEPKCETFAPASGLASGGLTFTLSGLSKISALPQMKLAWIVVGGPAAAAAAATERLEIIADTYLSPGTPVQLALPAFLELGRGMRAQISERIAANLACLDATLRGAGDAGEAGARGAVARSAAPSGAVARLEREGGWYAVLRVSSTHPAAQHDEALAVELVERCAVLAHPGSFYNFAGEGYLVVSLITRPEEFAEGIRRLVQFFDGQIVGQTGGT